MSQHDSIDGHEMCRSEIDALRALVKKQQEQLDKLVAGECLGPVGSSFVICGESKEYGFCSYVCRLRAERRIT